MDLIHLWLMLVGIVVILYVVLDGFSLGVGMLFAFSQDEHQRDAMMNSIAPVWDANQTWIVFGGGALFAVFPTIYTVLFSALYIPLFTFLFGLIFRGVAFEFRANTTNKTKWNRAFFIGSVVAAFAQGVTLGAYISGIKVTNGFFSGGAFDWLTPFNILVGLALMAGYTLLGACWLIMKTEGPLQAIAIVKAKQAAWAVAAFMIVVSVWTPVQHPGFIERWFSTPRIYFIWIFPIIGVSALIFLFKSLNAQKERLPFFSSLGLFLSAYLGLQSGLYPYAVLPHITITQAAAQHQTQVFTLWGVAFILPLVLGYNIYCYWVFRGKVQDDTAYH